ncbi:Malonyl CoA-acyl carrier protein transacylase [bacterium HR30]|nr:Malonyl CoA-acyl carrier protein transacylase [bacterium HR30]
MEAILLFPGQGSQAVGMGKAIYERYPYVRDLFAQADDALGFNLGRLCLEGPGDELTLTANAQPALLLVSTAYLSVLVREAGVVPVAAAGHSLGEFSALVAAGSLTFADALRVVRERGAAMQAAVPPGKGTMAAIIGLDSAAVIELCKEYANGAVVSPANFNGAGQVVISGEKEAVERVGKAARAAGAKRVLPLQVSAPFHCALMGPAAARLDQILSQIEMKPPRFPVISNVTARPYPEDVVELRRLLVQQVTEPVRWEECLIELSKYPPNRAIEVGPGRVLTNLAKRVIPTWSCIPAEDWEAVSWSKEEA